MQHAITVHDLLVFGGTAAGAIVGLVLIAAVLSAIGSGFSR